MLADRADFNGFLLGYGLVLALTLGTTALVLEHGSGLLIYGFPVAATIVGSVLIATRRSVYVAYVWWIWLFTPLVRRLVDFQSSYHNVSPVLITPLLVTGLALLAVILRPWFLLQRSMAPFLLFLLALLLALIVGVFTNGALPAVYDFVTWIIPPAFAMFLMMNPLEFEEIQTELVFAIILGLLLIAGYGMYQFFYIPPWDAFWLNASQIGSAGLAQNEQVHLFGPLNSPGAYAVVVMASLIFVVVTKGPLRLAAGALGFPAFGLSLVRSAWGGWVLAVLFVAWRVGGRTRLRILGASLIVGVAVLPLVTVGPVADAISLRLATLSNLQQDGSFQAREGIYESRTIAAFEQPIGEGFGAFGLASKLTTGQPTVLDSGLLQIPFEFGWVGGGMILWAMGVLAMRVLSVTRSKKNQIAIAGAGLFLAVFVQNIFASTFPGVIGMSLWTGLALALGPTRARSSVEEPAVF